MVSTCRSGSISNNNNNNKKSSATSEHKPPSTKRQKIKVENNGGVSDNIIKPNEKQPEENTKKLNVDPPENAAETSQRKDEGEEVVSATPAASVIAEVSKRKNEPAHYMLKIESFSLLAETKRIKIESDVFEASGHKWRLDLYPNGNGEKSCGNNISLYLVICDTGRLSKGWEVCADVNFFVYDHKSHNYATFQDIDGHGNRTRFNESKKIWGFDVLISLESFKESKNGYLMNDACVFGVEVFAVSEFAERDRCLSFIKPPAATNTYTWTIDKFSNVTEKYSYIHSNVFKVGNLKWNLSLYPKGNSAGKDTHISIYLKVSDHTLFPDGWRVYANFKLRVKNQSSRVNIEKEVDHWFSSSSHDYGFSSFVPLNVLLESANGFLVNDVLIVEVDIPMIGTLKIFI